MKKKEWQSSVITYLLIVFLGIISMMMIKSITRYYSSPVYKVDCYLRYLNTGQYQKIPDLLSKESIIEFKNKEAISDYYNRIYSKENKLISVAVKKCNKVNYLLEYTYAHQKLSGSITLTKEGRKWYIQFPFERQDVEIFAPFGSKVYLDSEVLSYDSQNGNYRGNGILPGNYLLRVCFEKEGYNDYYKMIEIPKEKSFIIPYSTAFVEINCPSHLKVSLGHFIHESVNHKAVFKDILQEDYLLHIQDEQGFIEAKEMQVNLTKDKNQFDIKAFKLTQKGRQELNDFIEQFYGKYIKAIICHNHENIASYFEKAQRKKQLQVFDDWYIKQKNISHVTMNLKIGDYNIDDSGKLHVMLREVSELTNEEENELTDESIERQYRVLLDFEVEINILEGEWKIVDRSIVQSLVAVKDQEGKWVQY